MDALRSRIKHLEPPIRLSDTWDLVRPRVEKYDEYKAAGSDDLRQVAFDKVMRRLREKEDELDRDRSRNGRHHDHRRKVPSNRHHSRSPEPDAYEADRRKAQAERERSYRRTGHDRRDRRPPSQYELERREREEERERLYRTRADPRGSRDELDYDADTQSTSERRRKHDSDAESSGRTSKRYRHDSAESNLPKNNVVMAVAEEEAKREEKAVHSGSEEGEIEEDD